MNHGHGTNLSESLIPGKPEPWAGPSRTGYWWSRAQEEMPNWFCLGATVQVPKMGYPSDNIQNQDLSSVSGLFIYFQMKRRNSVYGPKISLLSAHKVPGAENKATNGLILHSYRAF